MDHSLTNEDGVDYIRFLQKSEQILKYIQEIQQFLSWEDRRTMEKTTEIITNLIDRKIQERTTKSNGEN